MYFITEISHLMIIPREIQLEIATFTTAPAAGATTIDMMSLSRLARTSKYWRALINLKSPRFITPRELARRQLCVHLRQENSLHLLDVIYKRSIGHRSFIVESDSYLECFVTAKTVHNYVNTKWQWRLITRNKCITIDVLLELIQIYNIDKSTQFELGCNSTITCEELECNGLKIDYYRSIDGLTLREYSAYVNAYTASQYRGIVSDEEILLAHGEATEYFAERAKLTCADVINHIDMWNVECLLQNENIPLDFLETGVFPLKPLMNTQISRSSWRLKHSKKWREYQLLYIKTFKKPTKLFSKYVDFDLIIANPDFNWSWPMIETRTDVPIDFQDERLEDIYMKRYSECLINPEGEVTQQMHDFIQMHREGKLTIEIMLKHPEIKWNWFYYVINSNMPIDDMLNTLVLHAPGTIDEYFGKLLKRPDFTPEHVEKYSKNNPINIHRYFANLVKKFK